MRVLIINGFERDTLRGADSYAIFKELILKVFEKCKIIDNEFIEKRLDNISEFVLDWEHDNLDKSAHVNAKNFDKLDFIFVAGDMKICPWEPVATHVITLIHMCRQTKKPLFASGFGAFCAVYSLATKGARFHVLNGPLGDEIDKLPAFPRYSIGSGAYPSGWFDNETGDIYTYIDVMRSWEPVCNIGIYRAATYGAPSSGRRKHVQKRYAHQDRLLPVHQKVEALSVEEDVVHVRTQLLQHVAVRKLESPHFTVKPFADWYLNADGALPSGEGLFVVADGSRGPVLLAKDNMLLLTCKIEKSQCYNYIRTIMQSFVESQELLVKNKAAAHIAEGSLNSFLFGNGTGPGTYDTALHRTPMNKPLATQMVHSTVQPNGPIKVDPPIISMFFVKPKVDKSVLQAIAAQKRRDSTAGMGQTITVQNPLSSRHGRLKMLTARAGYNADGALNGVIQEAILQSTLSNPNELSEKLPESARELFTGRIMKDNNISVRRHHLSSFGERNNEVIYPKQLEEDATPLNSVFEDENFSVSGVIAASAEQSVHSKNSKNSSVVHYEFDQSFDNDNDEAEVDVLRYCQTIIPFTRIASEHRHYLRDIHSEPIPESSSNISESFRQIKTAAAGSYYDHSTSSFPVPDTPPPSFKPSHRTHRKHHNSDKAKSVASSAVPTIPDWYKVFNNCSVGGTGREQTTSQSAREIATPSRAQINEYVIRTARSARTADTISNAMTNLYLPVKHPRAFQQRDDDGSSTASECDNEFSHSTTLYSASQYSSGFLEHRVVLPTPKTGPYNSYKKLTKTIQLQEKQQASAEYKGLYTTEYVSEAEKPIKEYNESKKKFIAGPFLTSFGQARSAMVPGKIGFIRGQGEFPKEPLPGMPRGITAADWTFLKHSEANRNLAGEWKS